MQGDAYGIEIDIFDKNGNMVTPDDISDVEITVGHIRKTYKGGSLFYVDNGGGSSQWIFPLSQQETFRFPASKANVQIRIAWPNGEVEGGRLGYLVVHESSSKEVL